MAYHCVQIRGQDSWAEKEKKTFFRPSLGHFEFSLRQSLHTKERSSGRQREMQIKPERKEGPKV